MPKTKTGLPRASALGILTGAADDNCSAVGTYAGAGTQFGYGFLWAAPVSFPMIFTVVYLSAKLGQMAGQGIIPGTEGEIHLCVLKT
jgi:Mn2+/Fe2+ NRAMP family transporter